MRGGETYLDRSVATLLSPAPGGQAGADYSRAAGVGTTAAAHPRVLPGATPGYYFHFPPPSLFPGVISILEEHCGREQAAPPPLSREGEGG